MSEIQVKKFLPVYFTASFETVYGDLQSLSKFGSKFGLNDGRADTPWLYLTMILDFIDLVESRQGDYVFETYHKPVIALLDKRLLSQLVVGISEIDEYIERQAVEQKPTMSADKIDLSWLSLNDDTLLRWKERFSRLTTSNSASLVVKLDQLRAQFELLFNQLRYVAAALGATLFLVPTYSWEEFKENLENWDKLNVSRLARTVVEFMHNEYKKDSARELLNICLRPAVDNETDYTWEEAFLMTIFLHAIFQALPYLSIADRERCLTNYFYRAIMMGVPVREILQAIVYDTDTPVGYALETGRLLEAVINNVEMVVLDLSSRRLMAWSDIAKQYIDETKEAAANDKWQTQFVDRLLGADNAGGSTPGAGDAQLRAWLKEALSIFVRLKNGDLVDHNRGGELADDEKAYNDMVQLLAWFGVGEAGVSDIVKYLFQPEPSVTLSAFISRLKEVADLNQDVTVNNVMILSTALQTAGLLSPEEELVQFDESDGQFNWIG